MYAETSPFTVVPRWRSAAHVRFSKQMLFADDKAKPSANIRLCLWLIYYFTLCDTTLKFLPVGIALPLRYLPEGVLYGFTIVVFMKGRRVTSFPLFWPLCACALLMSISGILNSSPILAVIGDFRSFFRFAAFAYIGWRTGITPKRIEQFIDGFLLLTVVELIVGGLELVGGQGAQTFFSPALGWSSGTPLAQAHEARDAGGWIFGTMSDYNQFGMFMTISCVLALAMYFIKASGKYLWIASAAALAVVLSFSRHSLPMLALAVGIFFFFQRKRMANASTLRRFIPVIVCLLTLAYFGQSLGSAFEGRVASAFTQRSLAGDRLANVRLYLTMELTPRFLRANPLFGQGPVEESELPLTEGRNTALGPVLRAAPDIPRDATFFFGDVVWVYVLGLYGCFGLAAFGWVFWSIGATANKLRKRRSSPEGVVIAQACIVTVVAFVMSGFFSLEMISRDCIPVFWVLAGMVFSLATSPMRSMQVLGHRASLLRHQIPHQV
jgi:hypothetical protein